MKTFWAVKVGGDWWDGAEWCCDLREAEWYATREEAKREAPLATGMMQMIEDAMKQRGRR